jgi:TRAP transporter TAXI family solute receptor
VSALRLCWLLLLIVLLTGAACTRGADETRLQADLQTRLDRDVKPGLFKVTSIRREGSAPTQASETGASRVVVYFNATLTLAGDYSFGGWDQLGSSSVAYALGATDKGIFGLEAENRAGDLVRAYGSAIYEQSADGWIPVAAAQPNAAATATPNPEGTAPSTASKQLIDKLAGMVELPPPGVPAAQDQIIAEELARASENIERRVKRREHTFTLASGPEDGEYARFGTGLVEAVPRVAPDVKLRQRYSEGSIENAWLLERGEADYGIIQGDVAAAAVAGEGVFARGGPLTHLRAVGGLFPEPIHVVVLADSPIRDIAQLKGRRVDIGTPTSGTRFNAMAVLEAYGLKQADLGEAGEGGLTVAIDRLQNKQLDALFVTTAAPTRALQQLAATRGLRLLSIKGPALDRLVQANPGLNALTLPANTYPQQKEPVDTVAAVALLVTTLDAPQMEVERVTDLVFARMPQRGAGSADVVKVSAAHELRGVTIPLHPGAARQSDKR